MKRREGQSPSPTNGFTKVQTKIVSLSVKTEGFDTSLTEGGKGTDCHDQSADWSCNDKAGAQGKL